MAFAHGQIRHDGTLATLEPVWIAVDSTLDDRNHEKGVVAHQNQTDRVLSDLSNSLKHDIARPNISSIKKMKAKSKSIILQTPSTKGSLVASLPDPALPNFGIRRDFCKQLQRCCHKIPEDRYIGYLEKSASCKHLVYFPLPTSTVTNTQNVSLAQIMSALSAKSREGQFLQYERLGLAKTLASAVLQFHATPLLRNTWSGDDVVFFWNGCWLEVPDFTTSNCPSRL